MRGRTVGIFLVGSGLLAGIGMYYAQVFAFYDEVKADVENVQLTSLNSGMAEALPFENFKAIDADSSPLRFRACYDVSVSLAALTEEFVSYPDPEPRVAPGWFDCYDAGDIAAALESGEALAFLGEANVVYGIDRVVAVFRDGRARAWHQINICGDVVFDGGTPPEGCPPAPERGE